MSLKIPVIRSRVDFNDNGGTSQTEVTCLRGVDLSTSAVTLLFLFQSTSILDLLLKRLKPRSDRRKDRHDIRIYFKMKR